MSLGAFMSGFAGGMKLGQGIKGAMNSKELEGLQAAEFAKVDNPEAIEASGAYVKGDDGSYQIKPELLEGAAPDLGEKFKPTSESDATNNYTRVALARGLMTPVEAMEVRGKGMESEAKKIGLDEIRAKSDLRTQMGRIANEEQSAEDQYRQAEIKASEEIGKLGQDATAEQKEKIRNLHFGGLSPSEDRSYSFAQRRARLLSAQGDSDGAKKILDEATGRMAVGFNQAIVMNDLPKAQRLYRAYSGEFVRLQPGQDERSLIVTTKDGQQSIVQKSDLVRMATEMIKPGTLAAAMTQDEKYQEMTQRLMLQQQGSRDLAILRDALRDSSSGTGRSGRKSGESGSGTDSEGMPKTFSLKDFSSLLPEEAKSRAIDAHSWYLGIRQNTDPKVAANERSNTEAVRMAVRLANGEAKPIVAFNPSTLGWDQAATDESGRPHLLARNVSPMQHGISESDYKKQAVAVVEMLKKQNPEMLKQAELASSTRLENGKTVFENLIDAYHNGGVTREEERLINATRLYLINKGLPVPGEKPDQSASRNAGPLSMIGQAYGEQAKMAGESFGNAFNRLLDYHPDRLAR